MKELRERGRQGFFKLRGRYLADASALRDDAFLAEFDADPSGESAVGAAARCLDRIRRSGASGRALVPSFSRLDDVAALMETRFAEQRRAIIDRADRAARGRFDLLGFEDLSFGEPVDWLLEPVSGRRTPLAHWSTIDFLNPELAGDKKVTWELNRHAHFVTLGQAYRMTGEERYADAFVAQATAWMDANPPERGINWASSLELAFRSIAWTWAIHLFAESRSMTPELVLRLLKFLVAHGRHVESYLSHYYSPNTHLTGEALGLFSLGTAFPEFRRSGAWRAKALRIFGEQIDAQIRPDGVYFEQATYYHRYTADFLTHLVVLAEASGTKLPAAVRTKLAQLVDHLMWMTRPDGTTPLVGDDDGGQLLRLGSRDADDFRNTLATAAALFGRGDWKYVAADAAVETLWLLGPEAIAQYDAIAAESPVDRSRAFRESGAYVMRDGWERDSSFLFVDCGPHGAQSCAHAHADALAIEFAAEGVAWLVDPGTYTYTGDSRARDEFRSTAAHNTAVVDGEPQSVPAAAFKWQRVANAATRAFAASSGCDYVAGSHDGYERLDDPVTHDRSILFVKPDPVLDVAPLLVVRDAFAARGAHDYSVRFHFPAGCEASALEGKIEVASPGSERLTVSVLGAARPVASVEDGWVSRAYGRRDRAPVGVASARAEGSSELLSVLVPRREGDDVRVEPLGERESAIVGARVTRGRVVDVVLAGAHERLEGGHVLAASGSFAWARFVDGEPVRLRLFEGARIETNHLAFVAPVDVDACALALGTRSVEIEVGGTTRFELISDRSLDTIVVNGTTFSIDRSARRFAFTLDSSHWDMVGSAGRAD